MNNTRISTLAIVVAAAGLAVPAPAADEGIDAATIHGKVMCGYQGWFRCPGDAANRGWSHWSRDRNRITPATLSFELWPDMCEYGPAECFPAPGFTYPDGRPAQLFSSDSAATVARHFQWLRQYGIDGVWLQHFLVDMPGARGAERYPTRMRVLDHVLQSAQQTGRVWALSYDSAGMPLDGIYDVLTQDWKRMVDQRIVASPRYLHQDGRPVVQIWGFYYNNQHDQMSVALANKLIDFFKTPGPYAAYLVGGGSWNWRSVPDRAWQEMCLRFDAYVPWNVGNYLKDRAGDAHANTRYWADDQRECARHGTFWMPVVYPGFSWDNLTRKPPGTSIIPRRGGRFLWEQFRELAKLAVDSVYVAMFDEVDEGTAIFKVTSAPPREGHFVGYEGLPSDWYLRLVGEGARRLRGHLPIPAEIPIRP